MGATNGVGYNLSFKIFLTMQWFDWTIPNKTF